MRVPARNALLADVVPVHADGRAYVFERTMDNLGAIGGPLLALGLVSLFSVRTAILISVVPGLLAAVAIVHAIRQAKLPKVAERKRLRLQVRPVLRGQLGRVMAGFAAFEVGNVAATLLILRATDVPGRGSTPPRRSRSACVGKPPLTEKAFLAEFPEHDVSRGAGVRSGKPRNLSGLSLRPGTTAPTDQSYVWHGIRFQVPDPAQQDGEST